MFTLAAKMQHSDSFIPLNFKELDEEQSASSCNAFYELCNSRRTVRTFSTKPVPKAIVESIIKTAGTAPSGAHKQPWHFCAVQNPLIKSKIREAAEKKSTRIIMAG